MGLTVSHLHKKYGEKTVVEDLSFSMEKPGVFALLGTNGAGKTTSIRMMLGMLKRDGGDVLYNGAPLDTATCNVGYLAEERGLYPKYPLMDQLMYFAALRGVEKSEARKRIQYWAKRLEVEEYLYPGATAGALLGQQTTSPFGARAKRVKPKKADQLSKGNQQKIQLMAALLSDPELLILDEPLSGLDPVNTDLFKKIIREQIAKGKYLIMSSHQMPTVEEFCSDILIMDRSKTVLQGNLNEIKKQLGRVKLYLKTEQPADQIIDDVGVTVEDQKENENEYNLHVQGQAQANALLHALMDGGISVISFTLREPSLHEIFVAKVGGAQ